MTEWYIPITILPGVGLLIMSTSNILNMLSNELSALIKDQCDSLRDIIELKISQLGLITKSLVGFYISSACFVLAGLAGALGDSVHASAGTNIFILMIIGTVCVLVSLIFLTIYALRAVQIKKNQFKRSLLNGTKS